MKKNILLVGDLRTAGNYGAIATSNSIINMIKNHPNCGTLKLIESRSIHAETPINGWNNTEQLIKRYENVQRIKFKNRIIESKIKEILVSMKRSFSKKLMNSQFNLPSRFKDYEKAIMEVKEGNLLAYEKDLIQQSDVVIINAEGTIVNGTNSDGKYRLSGRYMLFMSYISKTVFNKDVYIVNHTVDPQNRDIQNTICNIYPLMDGVYVREKKSLRLLQTWGLDNIKYVPDALFSYEPKPYWEPSAELLKEIDFRKPFICLGDSTGFKNCFSGVKWDVYKTYNALIKELKKLCPQIVIVDGFNGTNEDINKVVKNNKLGRVALYNCTYEDLYYVLKNAGIYISGRWHTSIISLLARTPILLWGADSHKTEALYDEIGYPYRFFDINSLPINIDDILLEAQKVLASPLEKYWTKVEEIKVQSHINTDFL